MTKNFTYTQKNTGDVLSATEWNNLALDVDAAVDAINSGNIGGGSDMSSYLYMNDKGNLCIETTAENTPAGKKGKLNIESNDDIQLKPGDDIMLYGDHRGEGKTDEVSIKVMDGTGNDDVPAKLQLNMSEITLTTKDKTGDDANVLNINVNRAKNTKGYLKVRAQAIDLRCEDHGGIALQPKGEDSGHHMNKIKFEHGGGDGLEFGTFNTEHTSLFTDDYRFNKDGKWKMSTRTKLDNTSGAGGNDKYDGSDRTTRYSYEKLNDDLYDIISPTDYITTTKDIVTAGYFTNISGSSSNLKLVIGKSASYLSKSVKEWWFHVTEIENDDNLQKDVVGLSGMYADLTLPEDGKTYSFEDMYSMYTGNLIPPGAFLTFWQELSTAINYNGYLPKDSYIMQIDVVGDNASTHVYRLDVVHPEMPLDILFICNDGTPLSLNNDILPAVNYFKSLQNT